MRPLSFMDQYQRAQIGVGAEHPAVAIVVVHKGGRPIEEPPGIYKNSMWFMRRPYPFCDLCCRFPKELWVGKIALDGTSILIPLSEVLQLVP